MTRSVLFGAFVASLVLALAGPAVAQQADASPVVSTTTADHTRFKKLKQDFESGPEVTAACLNCHTEAAHQIMETIHWTWEYQSNSGQTLGKKTVINAFCGNVSSNEPRCTSCHAGYGWVDDSFDFTNQDKVDCLVCHDTTGTYAKWPTKAGHPLYEALTGKDGVVHEPPDLNKIAQNVGMPGRQNCGSCHFYGGGGDGVKHGDLDSSLVDPVRALDVHMSSDGAGLVCSDCHLSEAHKWPGSRYDALAADTGGTGKPGQRRAVASCQSCHGDTPHPTTIAGLKLNDHTDVVACQTCHIPELARGGVATKTWWDWSTAGQLRDGKPFAIRNEAGEATYMSQKGDFTWEEDVVPTYAFFDGNVRYTLLGDTIDPNSVVPVNAISGTYGDSQSRIWPFKLMRGKQAYDTENLNLVYTHVFGQDDTAFWSNFDWDKAIEAGMSDAGIPYSGKYGFVETEMWWPSTHMVAPAEDALDCADCHTKNGRLETLAGFYMPGRDSTWWLDWLGALGIFAALGGVLAHTVLRISLAKGRKEK